jgi:hypothetical protein
MTTVEAGRRRWHGTTQAERTEIMRAAANARWSKPRTPVPSRAKPRAEYRAWWNMIRRCERRAQTTARDWRRYGGRGICVCDRWRNSFEAFLADVGPRPGPGYSLDRIENNGNYEPGNVRWTTAKEQARNSIGRPPVALGKIRLTN